MKLFVVMTNDFPDSVFVDETSALAYVDKKDAEAKLQTVRGRSFGPLIYWRCYEFEVKE